MFRFLQRMTLNDEEMGIFSMSQLHSGQSSLRQLSCQLPEILLSWQLWKNTQNSAETPSTSLSLESPQSSALP